MASSGSNTWNPFTYSGGSGNGVSQRYHCMAPWHVSKVPKGVGVTHNVFFVCEFLTLGVGDRLSRKLCDCYDCVLYTVYIRGQCSITCVG